MDNLVLIRAAAAIGPTIRGAVLREIREESSQRFRLVFEDEGRALALVISLDPVLPWIGRPCVRWTGPRWAPGVFTAKAQHSLAGLKVRGFRKAGVDRIVTLELADGQALVAELATHGANLIHLDPAGKVVGAARHPRKAHDRIAPGQPYRPPALPDGKFVPFGASAVALDGFLRGALEGGEDLVDALRRGTFGIGSAAAELVLEESCSGGRSAGEVLAARLEALEAGDLDPVIVGPADPLAEAAAGTLHATSLELFPWPPPAPPSGRHLTRGSDAAATAGLFHEAVEQARRVAARTDALSSILRAEMRRLHDAGRRVANDLEDLGDPERFRRYGEALLAGIRTARRMGNTAWVADPYDPAGGEMAVPAPADRSLQVAAREHFQKARKARRGIEAAMNRHEGIRRRLERLERLEALAEGARGEEAADQIESALRGEGIPVGLGPATRAGRAAARAVPPRVEGVRLVTSSDGLTILIGRSGRDNDRLTFKLAGPDDFWFHATGVPGAHVVVRSPAREVRLPRATIEEAAAAAAWFSDARGASQAEVQWTRRKHVRRLRGAPPGTVTVKRFETIRVKPAPPAGTEQGSP